LRGMASDRLAHQTWLADIDLMLSGCTACWTYKLLHTLERLQLITPDQWRSDHGATALTIQRIKLNEAKVVELLARQQMSAWRHVVNPGSANPRTAPSAGIDRCTHHAWVYPYDPDTQLSFRKRQGPKYLKLCASFSKLQCYARLRMGSHSLQGRIGRMTRRNQPRQDRHDRLCPLCSLNTSDGVLRARMDAIAGADTSMRREDLLHFVLECPAYQHIREQNPDLFGPIAGLPLYSAKRMLYIFNHDSQSQVVRVLYKMQLCRRDKMGVMVPSGVHVDRQPDTFVPMDAALLSLLHEEGFWDTDTDTDGE
jgi:hypothetical protein